MSIRMRVLDLFSGIGGFSLGLERAGMETAAFCEMDKFCQKVLAKHWPDVEIYDDVRTITEQFTGSVDVICGGFPCQPFSVAGKQAGKEDDRHLWPAMLDCIKFYKPRWIIGENVSGFINMALDDVLSDLEGEGYECETFVLPACAVNAPHRRDRVWIVGNSKKLQRNGLKHYAKQGGGQFPKPRNTGGSQDVPNTTSERQPRSGKLSQRSGKAQNAEGETNIFESISIRNQWGIEPDVGRVAYGVSSRVDRLKALGNAVVPQIPEIIGRAIMEQEVLL
ncbi:DNA (cytosine-5-)-methyltransferase [bacterium]|nr:DNA (cytosine-5-)-methyltransferase [bacterium]